MYSPSPPAPMAAAMVAEPTPTTAATRMPATIDGSASGSSTSLQQFAGRHAHGHARFADRPDRSRSARQSSCARSAAGRRGSARRLAARAPTPPMSGTGQQEAEHREARHRLHDVGERRQAARPVAAGALPAMPSGTRWRSATNVDAATSSTCCAEQRGQLGPVRQPEAEEAVMAPSRVRSASGDIDVTASRTTHAPDRADARIAAGGPHGDQPTFVEHADARRRARRPRPCRA